MEGIQRLRDLDVREDLSFNTFSSYWKHSEEILYTNTMRNKFLRGVFAFLKSSVITLLYTPELTVQIIVTELENLNIMGIIGSQMAGAMWQYSTAKGEVAMATKIDDRVKGSNQNNLTCTNLRCLQIGSGIPRNEIDRNPAKSSLHPYKQKCQGSNEQMFNLNNKLRQL